MLTRTTFVNALRRAVVVPKCVLVRSVALFSTFSYLQQLATAQKIPPNKDIAHISAPGRQTFKHEFSRKTFLVDLYTYLNRTNDIILYVHHNNLTDVENKKFRAELTKAGGSLHIISNKIYEIFLRSEHEVDPADAETSARNKGKVHPLQPLLLGPTAIITIKECDPVSVASVLKVLKTASDKLFLIGAKIEQQVFDVKAVDSFKDLPTKEQLQSQLLGTLSVLGGSGLVQTLETPSKLLYLTGKELVHMQEGPADGEKE